MTCLRGRDLVSVWTGDGAFGLEQHSASLRPSNISPLLHAAERPAGPVASGSGPERMGEGVNPMGWMGIQMGSVKGIPSHPISMGAGNSTRGLVSVTNGGACRAQSHLLGEDSLVAPMLA